LTIPGLFSILANRIRSLFTHPFIRTEGAMVDQNKTELVCILDKSGSMGSLATDVIGTYNTFIEDQKKYPGEARVTLTLFNQEANIVHDGVPLTEVPGLTTKEYSADGTTALLDAIGDTINTIGKRLEDTPESDRPGQVVFMIFTDGLENASKEYSSDQIKDMIKEQESAYAWQFIFAGSGLDTVHYAMDSLQMKGSRSHGMVTSSAAGLRSFTHNLSAQVGKYRSSGEATDLDDTSSSANT